MPDGGDLPSDSYSMLVGGARVYIGRTGLAVSAALNANVDQLFRHGFSPTPLGGLVGFTYAAWPPLPPPPVVIPPPAAPAPIVEERVQQETVTTTTPPPPTPSPQPITIFAP